ncbi:MAG: hypothetical protein AAFY59_02335 [Pseudomonadota bacterium]
MLATPGAAAAQYAQTCKYFEAVAFNDSAVSARETFRMVLAADCRAALRTLGTARTAEDAVLAADYLDQLQLYRDTLLDMAMERFQLRRRPGVPGPRTTAGEPVVRPVSRAGAFLIAKSMGLVAKQREWTVWREAQANP